MVIQRPVLHSWSALYTTEVCRLEDMSPQICIYKAGVWTNKTKLAFWKQVQTSEHELDQLEKRQNSENILPTGRWGGKGTIQADIRGA